MATSTSQSTKKGSNNSAGDSRRQDIKGIIKKHLDTYFGSTLAKQDDIVNIFTALIHKESTFNVNAQGGVVSAAREGYAGYDYLYSPVIQNLLRGPIREEHRKRLMSGLTGMGLVQSMGWNHIKGASKKTGKCLLEQICTGTRSNLLNDLVIAPEALSNTSLEKFLLGEANMDKIILAGLLILESKWKACVQTRDGWKIGDYVYPLRISAAVSGYLGLGAKDANGTTPGAYTASIVGGDRYRIANGASAPVIRDSAIRYASVSGPDIALSSTTRVSPSGCVASQAEPSQA